MFAIEGRETTRKIEGVTCYKPTHYLPKVLGSLSDDDVYSLINSGAIIGIYDVSSPSSQRRFWYVREDFAVDYSKIDIDRFVAQKNIPEFIEKYTRGEEAIRSALYNTQVTNIEDRENTEDNILNYIPDNYVDCKEFAKKCKVTTNTVSNWCRQGKVNAILVRCGKPERTKWAIHIDSQIPRSSHKVVDECINDNWFSRMLKKIGWI